MILNLISISFACLACVWNGRSEGPGVQGTWAAVCEYVFVCCKTNFAEHLYARPSWFAQFQRTHSHIAHAGPVWERSYRKIKTNAAYGGGEWWSVALLVIRCARTTNKWHTVTLAKNVVGPLLSGDKGAFISRSLRFL